jgi:hypothetical protein
LPAGRTAGVLNLRHPEQDGDQQLQPLPFLLKPFVGPIALHDALAVENEDPS